MTIISELQSVDAYDSSPYTPEHKLLIAVLERATRDLQPYGVEHQEQRDAVRWFLTTKKRKKSRIDISFAMVILYLDLTEDQVKYLQERARKTEQRLDGMDIKPEPRKVGRYRVAQKSGHDI